MKLPILTLTHAR